MRPVPISAALGWASAYLFNEHFVIKPPRSEWSAFAWHRDSTLQLAALDHAAVLERHSATWW